MTAEFRYTAMASLLNAVDEVAQCYATDGAITVDVLEHLVRSANRAEIQDLARELRQAAKAADGQNP